MKYTVENRILKISLPEEVLGGELAFDLSNAISENIDIVDSVLIDLTKTTVMNSSGLGMIVSSHSSVAKNKKKLIVACPNTKIMDLFQMTHLNRILLIEDSLEGALSKIS